MPQSIKQLMTKDPIALDCDAPVTDAAKAMDISNIGDVIVLDDGNICGIVTDRDITVRVVAKGLDPQSTKLSEICSKDPTTLTTDSSADEAVSLMREKAIRRLPVVEDGKPVGIVSLGDLAIERDSDSALAEISEAPPQD